MHKNHPSFNIIYLNFEDKRVSTIIKDGAGLISYVETHRKIGKCYLFLDEVQILDGWQDACKTLRLYDYSVKQYSTKTKRELSYYSKVYNTDVAFNSIRCQDNHFDLTHNLESVVYNELIYMGYDIYVYNNAGKEIDSLAQKGNKKYFIQVAHSVAEDKAYNREFEAFKGIDNLSQKILITNDEIDRLNADVIRLKDENEKFLTIDFQNKIKAIEAWRNAGNIFAIISGRSPKDLLRIFDEKRFGCDYLIADNGAVIMTTDGEIISQASCDSALAVPLIELIFNCGCKWAYVQTDNDFRVYADPENCKNDREFTLADMPEIKYFNLSS